MCVEGADYWDGSDTVWAKERKLDLGFIEQPSVIKKRNGPVELVNDRPKKINSAPGVLEKEDWGLTSPCYQFIYLYILNYSYIIKHKRIPKIGPNSYKNFDEIREKGEKRENKETAKSVQLLNIRALIHLNFLIKDLDQIWALYL